MEKRTGDVGHAPLVIVSGLVYSSEQRGSMVRGVRGKSMIDV